MGVVRDAKFAVACRHVLRVDIDRLAAIDGDCPDCRAGEVGAGEDGIAANREDFVRFGHFSLHALVDVLGHHRRRDAVVVERRGDGFRLRSGVRIAAAAFDLEDDFTIGERLVVECRGERRVDVVVGAIEDGAFCFDGLARGVFRESLGGLSPWVKRKWRKVRDFGNVL